jgi:hypothetical protein
MSFWSFLKPPPAGKSVAPSFSNKEFADVYETVSPTPTLPPLSETQLQEFQEQERRILQEESALKEQNPDCAKLIDFITDLLPSLDDRIYIIKTTIQKFRALESGRTQEQIIQLAQQPCFKIELKSARQAIARARELINDPTNSIPPDQKKEMIQAQYDHLLIAIIDGLDDVYHAEVDSRDGILTFAKTYRGVYKWGRPPCGLTLSDENYFSLNAQDKLSADTAYKELGLPRHVSKKAYETFGGKRKTKKRRSNKKMTRKR